MTQLPRIPQPYQLGIVVKDLDAAIKYWSSVIGIGPFFLLQPEFDATYRGEKTSPVADVAISYWGDLQLELIHQLDDSPSPYRTFLDAGLEGVHHTSSIVPSMEEGVKILADQGKEVVFTGSASGFSFAYAVEDEHPGTVIELMEDSEQLREFLKFTMQAVRDWDGKDPIRHFG